MWKRMEGFLQNSPFTGPQGGFGDIKIMPVDRDRTSLGALGVSTAEYDAAVGLS